MSRYEDGDDDFDWVPPSEAEMKVIEAKRERQDKISKLMSQYLLKGYKMLASTCPTCMTIELKSKEGEIYCIACQEVDCHETSKDNPVLNANAARSLLGEQSASLASPRPAPPVSSTVARLSQTIGNSVSINPTLNKTPEKEAAQGETASEAERSIEVVLIKLSAVRQKLAVSSDDQIQQNTDMIRFIKEGAEALAALKKLV